MKYQTWNKKTIYQQLEKEIEETLKSNFINNKGYFKNVGVKNKKDMIEYLLARAFEKENTTMEEIYYFIGIASGLKKAKEILEKEEID